MPWYREPLAWMVLGIPALAVVVGGVMLTLSMRDFDGLVVDDYYKRGKQINMSLARDETAARHDLRGALSIRRQTLRLQLDARTPQDGYQQPSQVLVQLLFATRRGFDQQIVAERDEATDDYVARVSFPREGRWYVQAEADDWRILGVARVPADTEALDVVLVPQGL